MSKPTRRDFLKRVRDVTIGVPAIIGLKKIADLPLPVEEDEAVEVPVDPPAVVGTYVLRGYTGLYASHQVSPGFFQDTAEWPNG